MPLSHEIDIRVRYQETDGQGRLHHANYFTYFEMGRVELLRSLGHSYRDLEESGLLLVVVDISCKYFLPASYDDVLRLLTEVAAVGGVRIEHHYEVRRGEELLAQGRSVIACINRQGKPTRLPDYLKVV